jgi:hypothetical protein
MKPPGDGRKKTRLPDAYSSEYLVFCACEGDMSKREWVESRYTMGEVLRWLCLKKYDTAE